MSKSDSWYIELSKYKNYVDNSIKNKYKLWSTAIGLQDMSNLKVSNYLIELAKQNIDGLISIDYAIEKIEKYHEVPRINIKTIEADLVSVRMVKVLSDNNFELDILN